MLKKVSTLIKATDRSHKGDGKRNSRLDAIMPDFSDINISNYFGQKVTLDLKKLASNNI